MALNNGPTQSLTHKERMVLEFVESFILNEGLAPTYTEIQAHFNFASINSVQRYLQQLDNKGYIQKGESNQKRSLVLLKSSKDFLNDLHEYRSGFKGSNEVDDALQAASSPAAVSLPLLGKVAAGLPLEEKSFDERVDVPLSLVPKPTESFVLRVRGESMIEEGIFDGDLVVIEKRSFAGDGSLVVATTEDESATVKRIFYKKGMVELRPANASMSSFWYEPHKITIQGLVIGLVRQYLPNR